MVLGTLLLGCGDGVGPGVADPEAGCPLPGVGVSVGGFGGVKDSVTMPTRRLVLMGGGPEDDAAAEVFVEAAGGGDVVVLRASGSLTSYPTYFSSTLAPAPAPASAVTVLTSVPSRADQPGVVCRLERAEAVWLAGGNQWDYLDGWPASLHDLLSDLVSSGIAVGGTSAGAMVLGEAAFDAELGGIDSNEALLNPLGPPASLSYPVFSQPELAGTLVDTHFQDRSREGRMLAFLARFVHERGLSGVVGIGLDEGAALIIEEGRYRVSSSMGGSVWIYELAGPVDLQEGSPLNLARVLRLRLDDASEGPWPMSLDAGPSAVLRVEDGVISRAP